MNESHVILRINGLTNVELGLWVSGLGAAWSQAAVTRPEVGIPGRFGAITIGEAVGRPKVIPTTFTLPAKVSERVAALDDLLSVLTGTLEVEWIDAPDRLQFARVDESEIRASFEEVQYVETTGHLRIGVDLRLDAPLSFARESSVLAVGSTPVPVPLGTAPSDTTFVLPGALTDATLTYRGASGEILSQLSLDGTVDAGEFLRVRSDRQTIWLGDGTGEELDMSFFAGGGWIVLDPGDADYRRGVFPTVESSEPGVLYYRRAWL